MKICNDCNVEMLENGRIEGQHPFEIGVDGSSKISVHIPTNEKGNFLGIKYNKEIIKTPKVRLCPKCGKIEMYVDLNDESRK